MLGPYVILKIRFGTEAHSTSDAVPSPSLLAVPQIELSANKVASFSVNILHVNLEIAGFSKGAIASRPGALEGLSLR